MIYLMLKILFIMIFVLHIYNENGTDMSGTARKDAIEKSGGILSLCQIGCRLQSYNHTNKKAKYDYSLKNTKNITNLNDI